MKRLTILGRRTLWLLAAAHLPLAAGALTSNWILQNADGNWSDPANWDNGVPMTPGDIAVITNAVAPTVGRTITINTNVSLKALKFAIPTTSLNPALTIQLGTGGSLTMNSGDGSHSVIQQLRGSARCKITAPTTLSNDVDVINTVGAASYFDVSTPMSGTFNLHINTDGSTAQPYMGAANTFFFGNIYIHCGTLMINGNDSFFGSLTNGMRQIVFENNASLRNNGSLSVLGTNRQFVVGTGGGTYNIHGKNLALPIRDQLTGSEVFTLSTDSGGNTNNIFTISAANNSFTGTMFLSANVALKLGSNGSISNCPLVNLSTATSLFDSTDKPSGYSIPANQILAGIGVVTGRVNVANAAATIHPGITSVRSPGILTFAIGGLSFADGGIYAWDMKQLKDNAYPAGVTTYSTINVTDGSASFEGGKLMLGFLNGIATPASADPFWQTNHVWTILTASTPPTGTLTVVDGTYTDWAFTTRVTGNTLELVYGPYTAPQKGTLISVK